MKRTDFTLYVIIGSLVIVILLGTVFGLLNGHKPAENFRDADPAPKEITSLNKRYSEKNAAFTELGQIRAVTKGTQNSSGSAVVITPWLSYPEGDTVFFEELSRKRLVIKGIFQTYFSEHTQSELLQITEDNIKQDLLEKINEQLTLGKISAVYFSEYIFLS